MRLGPPVLAVIAVCSGQTLSSPRPNSEIKTTRGTTNVGENIINGENVQEIKLEIADEIIPCRAYRQCVSRLYFKSQSCDVHYELLMDVVATWSFKGRRDYTPSF